MSVSNDERFDLVNAEVGFSQNNHDSDIFSNNNDDGDNFSSSGRRNNEENKCNDSSGKKCTKNSMTVIMVIVRDELYLILVIFRSTIE